METTIRNITIMIDEVNKVIALTGRVKRRKEEYLAATPHICVERSHLVTESHKETEGEPLDIRRAKLFKKIMEELPIVIREGELVVGSQTQYIRGASPEVDFRPDTVFELFKASKLTLSGVAAIEAEISEADKASLLQDAGYWRGKSGADAMAKVRHEVIGNKIDDLAEARVFIPPDTRPTGSRCVDYQKVLEIGFNGIIAEAKERLQKLLFSDKDDINKYHFYQAVIIAAEGVIKFAHRYAKLAKELAGKESDAVRRVELEKIANTCQWVPANPARTFYEALQSFWFTHLCVELEAADSSEAPGRMDQYMYPFYKRDLEEGRLNRQEAAELLGLLWIKFTEMEHLKGATLKEMAQASQFQNVTIGGVTKDGRDATNELTYLLLEVARQLKTSQPPLYLSCHKGMAEELWMKAVEVNRDRGDGVPAFMGSEAVVLNLVGLGIPIQEARDHVFQGCVFANPNHGSAPDKLIQFNLAKVFELTLNNGVDPRTGKQLGLATGDPRGFSSFNELYDAFKKQFDFLLDLTAKDARLTWQVRREYYSLPFSSALTDGCMSKGMDQTAGGVRYLQFYWSFRERAHQNTADSLTAIKKLVFEEKKISMADLLDACVHNFEGDGREQIRQMCLAAPKYGNDDDYVDEIFSDLSLWIQRRIYQEKNPLGANLTTGRVGGTLHYAFGKTVGALPDGRKAWQPMADGFLSPMRGMDVKGPTAVINSATKVNHTEVASGALFNMKIPGTILQNRQGLQKLISLIKTHFDRGGYHIQFNLMGQKILLEAKKHPEKYRDLLVRVAGYSAYFVELSPAVQDEIIARTEHTL